MVSPIDYINFPPIIDIMMINIYDNIRSSIYLISMSN